MEFAYFYNSIGTEVTIVEYLPNIVPVEDEEVSKQLEHRIKNLQNLLQDQQSSITQMQSSQSDDKFYARAIKLAKKGAGLDEIVTECELPRAEVEMLLSVYQGPGRP